MTGRLGAVRHTLEVVRAARFLVEGDAGLMRGFELYLVTHHRGDGDAHRAEQAHETQEQNDERWAADGTIGSPGQSWDVLPPGRGTVVMRRVTNAGGPGARSRLRSPV